jgi:hypothetical protein
VVQAKVFLYDKKMHKLRYFLENRERENKEKRWHMFDTEFAYMKHHGVRGRIMLWCNWSISFVFKRCARAEANKQMCGVDIMAPGHCRW